MSENVTRSEMRELRETVSRVSRELSEQLTETRVDLSETATRLSASNDLISTLTKIVRDGNGQLPLIVRTAALETRQKELDYKIKAIANSGAESKAQMFPVVTGIISALAAIAAAFVARAG